MTSRSSLPTISSVGAATCSSASKARSGRPPRETIAPTTRGSAAAAINAAAAPVLAPKYPTRRARVSGSPRTYWVARLSRCASRSTSKRSSPVRRSRSSSAGVSRSNRSVASPDSASCRATSWLRGLCREEPLPCANRTIPRAPSGTVRSPASRTSLAGIVTGRVSRSDRSWGIAHLRPCSQSVRVRLGRLAGVPQRHALERLDGAGHVQVHHRVELPGEQRPEVVAPSFAGGQIQHADGALEARLPQPARRLPEVSQVELEARDSQPVEERLVASGKRAPHAFPLRRPAPLGGRGDLAGVGRESDQEGVAPVPFPHELSHVQLASLAHVGGTRVAEVRVVLPNHDLAASDASIEVAQQLLEGPGHVPVAPVPGLDVPPVHRPVVFLGILHHARVLDRLEPLLPRISVARRVARRTLLQQLDELLHHRVLARSDGSQRRAPRVLLDGASEVVEAAVALSGEAGGLRIDLPQIPQDFVDRRVQAVQIEAVEADLRRARREGVIVRPQPAHEVEHVRVAPHPDREPLETGKGGVGVPVLAQSPDEAVDPVRVGPVRLDRDSVKAFFDDQALGEPRPLGVEIVRAVRGLAQQDQPGVADCLDERIVRVTIRERPGAFAQALDERHVRGAAHGDASAPSFSPRPRMRFTSSSVVGEKSSYQSPTAWKGSGVAAQTIRSTSRARASQVSGEAMGTATMIWRGPWRRSASTAARIVEPVARPSSTKIG